MLIYLVVIRSGGSNTEFPQLIVLSFVGAIIVLFFVLFWGLPVHYLLRKSNKSTKSNYALAGMAPSLLFPIDHYVLGGGYGDNFVLHTLYFSIIGIVINLTVHSGVLDSA